MDAPCAYVMGEHHTLPCTRSAGSKWPSLRRGHSLEVPREEIRSPHRLHLYARSCATADSDAHVVRTLRQAWLKAAKNIENLLCIREY